MCLQFVEEMIKAGTIVEKKSTIKVETGSKNKVVALDTSVGIAAIPVDQGKSGCCSTF